MPPRRPKAEKDRAVTDFILVLATVAGFAAAPATLPPKPAALAPMERVFRTYRDAASCEQAAATLAPPAGTRLVCLPVEGATVVETAF
jgi:hypothetical protein